MSQQATSAKKETTKKTASRSAEKTSEPSLNMDELRDLANLVDEHGFTDFEFENANIRVRLSKNPAPQIIQTGQSFAAPAALPASTQQPVQTKSESQAQTTANETAAADENTHVIPSPIVGTFYRSPAPDKDPYVKEGSSVSPDTIVCIIEAMKLMNEIEAEVSGEVVKILVENGQSVEYGQPLFEIKK